MYLIEFIDSIWNTSIDKMIKAILSYTSFGSLIKVLLIQQHFSSNELLKIK
jgi:hypothetical protein